MLQVRRTRFFHGVVVNVDHVVEHAHRGAYGFLQLDLVENVAAFAVINHVIDEVDRAEITYRDFGVAGVERDLGAEIR